MEFRIDDMSSPIAQVMTPRNSGFQVQEDKNKLKLFLAEMLGMTTFVALSLSNITIYALLPSKMAWEGVAIAWGFNLLLGIKVASYGNAYLNPCIAACDYLLAEKITFLEFVIYSLAELVGAFAGAAIVYGLNYNLYPDKICNFFGTSPASGINYTQAFFIEFIGTALFAFCIFKILNSKMQHAEYAIAASLTAIVMSLGYHTAFSYNWARDFGPRAFASIVDSSCMNDYSWIPFIADFLGAFFGWTLSRF